MQDIHAIGGGAGGGRLFGNGGDRRLRPLNHPNHQAVKCPRCDSLNTKFCYYNNYNLSQPRHFCKTCRRYWTKGGVLRNVPVGGGCRKTKRSKSKPSSAERKSNSNSSSESSSLTASTTAANTATATTTTTTTTTEVVSGSSSNSASTLINYPDSKFFIPQTTNPTFDPPVINQSSDSGMFPEIGSFTSMMTSSEPPIFSFNVTDYRLQEEQKEGQVWREDDKLYSTMGDEFGGGFVDKNPTAEIDLRSRRMNCGVPAAGEWQGGVDEGLFELTGNVDQWNHNNEWTVSDQHLNFLP